MNANVQRRPATPYARRLARERGIDLLAITGSGPNGRIVAADVEAFAPRKPEPLVAPQTTVTTGAGVLAATIDFGAVNALLANLAGGGMQVTLDDMLVRAAAQALEHQPDLAAKPVVVALEVGGGQSRRSLQIEDPQNGLMTALHARIDALRGATDAPAGRAALLSIRRITVDGIRAVSMPLVDDAPLRLVVSAGSGDAAEALLVFDAVSIAEDSAARLLAAFRDAIEIPLRLLA